MESESQMDPEFELKLLSTFGHTSKEITKMIIGYKNKQKSNSKYYYLKKNYKEKPPAGFKFSGVVPKEPEFGITVVYNSNIENTTSESD